MPLQRRGIKDKKLHNEIYSHFMGTHLQTAMDAVDAINSNWGKVERKLASEW